MKGTSKPIINGINRKITISRGLEEVPRCFKANISATTPAIYEYMKINAFIQGGWNRYDFIIGLPIKPEEIKLLKESFFHLDLKAKILAHILKDEK